jgi:hypothetical protein
LQALKDSVLAALAHTAAEPVSLSVAAPAGMGFGAMEASANPPISSGAAFSPLTFGGLSLLPPSGVPQSAAAAAAVPSEGGLALRALDLAFSRGVSDAGVGCLVDAAPHLSRLIVWGCSQLSERLFDGHRRAAGGRSTAHSAIVLQNAGRGGGLLCPACTQLGVSGTGFFRPPAGAGSKPAHALCTCGWAPLRVYGRPGDVMPEPELDPLGGGAAGGLGAVDGSDVSALMG